MNCESSGKKIIVEIGPGGCPVRGSFLEVSKQVTDGTALYFAIDRYTDNTYIKPSIRGCIDSIPLLSGKVDELWLMNVFAELCLHGVFDHYPTREHGELVIPSWNRGYFDELSRVLKPGGIINIGEYYDPDLVKWLTAVNYRDFALEKAVFTDAGVSKFLEKYPMIPELVSIFFRPPRPDTFFMTLTKSF